REAERVHPLAIDEDVRRDAFLEFALAGAVSIKSLSAYAKDLAKTVDPAEAYRQFRLLCIKRTLGGLPPWGSMSKDLARLVKAAKLDETAEQRSILEGILESPSLGSAAACSARCSEAGGRSRPRRRMRSRPRPPGSRGSCSRPAPACSASWATPRSTTSARRAASAGARTPSISARLGCARQPTSRPRRSRSGAIPGYDRSAAEMVESARLRRPDADQDHAGRGDAYALRRARWLGREGDWAHRQAAAEHARL